MRNDSVRYFASENLVWQEGHDVAARVVRNGDGFVVDGFRNFRHLPDGGFEGGYESRAFDLASVTGMDWYSVPFWAGRFSHLIASFRFDCGSRLCLSVEARRRPGQSYSVALGFLGHFGLTYVWGSEEDILGIRLLRRADTAYRFRSAFGADLARRALSAYLDRTESIARRPESYHSLLKNCTTELLEPFSYGLPALWKFRPAVVFSSRFHELFRSRFSLGKGVAIDPADFSARLAGSGSFEAALDSVPE